MESNLEKKIYIYLYDGYLEADKILEKNNLLELENLIQNTCKINFHINIDENYIFLHGYSDNILNLEFRKTIIKAINKIKDIFGFTIKYSKITITECKDTYKKYNLYLK